MSNSTDLKLVSVVSEKHFPEHIFDICFEVDFFSIIGIILESNVRTHSKKKKKDKNSLSAYRILSHIAFLPFLILLLSYSKKKWYENLTLGDKSFWGIPQ